MERYISSITTYPGDKTFRLGDIVNDRTIVIIEDKSIEQANGTIDTLYLLKDENNNVLVVIENWPVIVYYEYTDDIKAKSKKEQIKTITLQEKAEQTIKHIEE